MIRSICNCLAHLVAGRPDGWYPLLGVYYLTYACDMRCTYCSDGSGIPYYRLPDEPVSGAGATEIMRTMRRWTDYLVITGGEPLRHPDFVDVLSGLPALRFDGVVLTTNGCDVAPYLQLINASVRYLVFSLDTLNEDRAGHIYGRRHVLDRILSNIESAASVPERRYEIIISAVATPDNLEDLPELYQYCRRRGFRFALCPQLLGVKPHPALRDNPGYRRVFDMLISEKRRGGRIHGSVPYLEHMRDLQQFSCRPSTVLAVSPAGNVFYPCLEIGHAAGSLADEPDIHTIRRQARERFGEEPRCDNRCHSACALGFSLLLNRPWSIVHEAVLAAKSTLRRTLRGYSSVC
ncbi:MAG: radical SAM protein [Acidobacteriota bacterium]